MTNTERRNAYKREWYAANKERLNKKSKEYVKNNPEKRKATVKKYKTANKDKAYNYILANYEWYLFNSARTRARIHKVPFNITVDDIIIPSHCPYLKTEITRIQGQGRQDTNPSVDRIDPTKGYTKDNIRIISDKANRMKNSATLNELITFAESVIQLHRETT